ncbi:hypothetical protein MKX01_026766 [Papaver californicum]|nr:hypothetical protein MKX01_026766 [Papaver californicum]
MDDNNEPNSLMYQQCENILNSKSSILVNHDTATTPQLQQVPPNDYDELPSLGPDMSATPEPLFEFRKSSLFQKSSTSPPPAPEVLSSTSSSPRSNIICFGDPSSPVDDPTKASFSYGNLATLGATVLGTNSSTVLHLTESHLNKHQKVAGNTLYSRRVQNAIIKPLVAERHRREKLNQHFIALSAQIPGLKKIDRASVLEEATKYLKQLKEKVKTLEEEKKLLKMSTTTKTTRSSDETTYMPSMNKKMKCDDDNKQVENSKNRDNTNNNSDGTDIVNDEEFSASSCKGNYEDGGVPEIEAKISHNNMFIRIHCEKHEGVLEKVIKEIEKLHLTVLQSSIMPSENSTLYITLISQVTISYIFL